MIKKITIAVLMCALALNVVPIFAQGQKGGTSTKTPAAKPAATAASAKTVNAELQVSGTVNGFANGVAVCGCGKVFAPSASTKNFAVNGKQYACCSEECHKKLATMNAADAAKLCESQIAKLEAQSRPAAVGK